MFTTVTKVEKSRTFERAKKIIFNPLYGGKKHVYIDSPSYIRSEIVSSIFKNVRNKYCGEKRAREYISGRMYKMST